MKGPATKDFIQGLMIGTVIGAAFMLIVMILQTRAIDAAV